MRAISMIDVAQSCNGLAMIGATCREIAEAIGNADPWLNAEES